MFTIDFAKEIEGSGVTINALDPGLVNTRLGDSLKLISKFIKLIKRFWKPPEFGAEAPSWLAIDEKLSGINGKYYNKKNQMEYIDEVKKVLIHDNLRFKTEEIINKNSENNKIQNIDVR